MCYCFGIIIAFNFRQYCKTLLYFHLVFSMIHSQKAFGVYNAPVISFWCSLLPATLSLLMSALKPDFSLLLSLITLCFVFIAHLLILLINQYNYQMYQCVSSDRLLVYQNRYEQRGIYHWISSKHNSKNALLNIILILLFLLFCMIGVMIWQRGWIMIVLFALLFVSWFFYWHASLISDRYNVGSCMAAFIVGPLVMITMQYVSSGTIDIAVVAISIAVGSLALNWFYLNNRMRREDNNDEVMSERYNDDNFICSLILTFLPFCLVTILIVLGFINLAYISLIIITPLLVFYIKSIHDFYKGNKVLLKKNFWMGPMECEAEFVAAGFGWYRQRWCLARNLLYFFVLIMICVNCAIIIVY